MEIDNERCLIMMASYNGEKYLHKQLKSIMEQTYTNWDLVVQDDGSSDGTMKILEEAAAQDPRITFCRNESGNHGPYQNFNVLINKCRAMKAYDYYLFADQDDLWDADKLETFISFVKEKGDFADVPVLVYGDMRVINEKDEGIIGSLNAEDMIERDGISMFFDASVWGCNFFFNRALFMDVEPVADDSERVWGHDQYFARWAGIRGQLYFMKKIVMNYRRYTGSVTAEHELTVTAGRIGRRLKQFDQLCFDHAVMYKSALFVLSQLGKKELTEEEKRTCGGIERCIRKGGPGALFYFRKHHVDLGRKVRTMSHLLILVMGRHRKHLAVIH